MNIRMLSALVMQGNTLLFKFVKLWGWGIVGSENLGNSPAEQDQSLPLSLPPPPPIFFPFVFKNQDP